MLSEVQMQELLVRSEMAVKRARACPGPNSRGSMSWSMAYQNDVSMLLEELQSLQVENEELKSRFLQSPTVPTVIPVVDQEFPSLDDDL